MMPSGEQNFVAAVQSSRKREKKTEREKNEDRYSLEDCSRMRQQPPSDENLQRREERDQRQGENSAGHYVTERCPPDEL
jgi:hypothetical protein